MSQTYLPLPSFSESARVLDTARLGKQRLEAYQIVASLTGWNPLGWKIPRSVLAHPCTRSWVHYETALKAYYSAIIKEWVGRGHRNTMPVPEFDEFRVNLPLWFGGEIHERHQAKLLARSPAHYKQFGWKVKPDDSSWFPEIYKGVVNDKV